jgi:tRNA pseudouridine65 synthase
VSLAGDFWADLPLGRGVSLLARDDNGLAALDKPAGVLSHPNSAGDEPRSLLTAAYSLAGECYHWDAASVPFGTPRRLWLLNRLDSATSGVILVAADAALAAAVRDQFRRKNIHKIYQALVFGRPRAQDEIWRDRLAVQKQDGRIRTARGHLQAESGMRVVRSGHDLTLLWLEPRTGRSHQLRVQCARRGLPIVGDQTYGDFRRNRQFAARAGTRRLFLHSLETGFEYEFKGTGHAFEARAPLPPEFEIFL